MMADTTIDRSMFLWPLTSVYVSNRLAPTRGNDSPREQRCTMPAPPNAFDAMTLAMAVDVISSLM